MDNIDFEDDCFMSDEDVNDAVSDLVIMKIGKLAEIVRSAPKVINEQVLEYLKFTYKTMKYIVGDSGVVSYKLQDDLMQTMGSVTAEIKNGVISFDNLEWLYNMAVCATAIDIYPKTNGSIAITFSFDNLWIISEGDNKC